MDVTASNFEANLHEMLDCLGGSHFVALDLELSGVPPIASGRELDSLQERYLDIKSAADNFSAIQIGFTIVHEEKTPSYGYTGRPYNMCLGPLIDESLDLSRNLTFSNRATSFLLGKGFSMHKLFHDGVPYLSRREVKKAEKKEEEKTLAKSMPDVILQADDVELHAFIGKTKQQIQQWCKMKDRPHELMISHEQYLLTRAPSTGLSRLEKRLVHQLVRTHYPQLVATARGGAVEITAFNADRDNALKKQRQAAFKECLQKQIGLRWFVEALVGGCFEDLDVVQLITRSASQPVLVDVDKAKAGYVDLCALIRKTKIVLVGHNLFVDLVFFYRTFIGHLPHHVDEFCTVIHELFPLIIDTKFMATQANFRRPNSSLEEVDAEYAHQPLPKIAITDSRFDKYRDQTRLHEAGFDSFVTARLLIRMAAYLAARKGCQGTVPGQTSNQSAKPPMPEHDPFRWLLSPSADPAPPPAEIPPASHTTDLIDLSEPEPPPTVKPLPPHLSITQNVKETVDSKGNPEMEIKEFIPPWDSPFWKTYGNKLRVYGTVEGELNLGPFELGP